MHSQAISFSQDASASSQMSSYRFLQIHIHAHFHTHPTLNISCSHHCALVGRTSASSILSFTLPVSISAFLSSATFYFLYPFSIKLLLSSFSSCSPINSQAVTLILSFHTGCRGCLLVRHILHRLTSTKNHTHEY